MAAYRVLLVLPVAAAMETSADTLVFVFTRNVPDAADVPADVLTTDVAIGAVEVAGERPFAKAGVARLSAAAAAKIVFMVDTPEDLLKIALTVE